MYPPNDLSGCFSRNGTSQTLYSALNPNTELIDQINSAESEIRVHLREVMPQTLTQHLNHPETVSTPKFRKQGSAAYGLLNDPLRHSKHYSEADYDLGVYLPVKNLKQADNNPTFAAQAYLEVVENILEELSQHRGWSVRRKSCCIRVRIRSDAHIDVTCYAIPDHQFRKMAKAAFEDGLTANLNFSERDISWDELPERPLLATDNGWNRSDARAIHLTIDNAFALHGPALKRNIRYIKAARDFLDEGDGPTSIALTLILARNTTPGSLSRDDIGVLRAFECLADAMHRHIPAPGNEDVDILAELNTDRRSHLSDCLRQHSKTMRCALYDQDWGTATSSVQGIFGSRFPSGSRPPDTQKRPDGPTSRSASAVTASAPYGNARSA